MREKFVDEQLDYVVLGETDLDHFLHAVEDAVSNKEHVGVHLLTMHKLTPFLVIDGINPDYITFDPVIETVEISHWSLPYTVDIPTQPDTGISIEDVMIGVNGYACKDISYTFPLADDMELIICFHYDEVISQRYKETPDDDEKLPFDP